MKFLIVFISVLFLLQVQALNKADGFNHSLPPVEFNLVQESMSELQEVLLPAERAKLNSNSPSAVSHVVLFEDRKPVCVADAVGRPELVPPFMKVTTGKPPEASGSVVDLPPCDNFQLSVLRGRASEALLINGEEPVQVAELGTLLAAGALCAAGVAAGGAARFLKNHSINHTEQGISVDVSLSSFTALLMGVPPAVVATAIMRPEFSFLTGLPILGFCGLGTYHVAGYFTGE